MKELSRLEGSEGYLGLSLFLLKHKTDLHREVSVKQLVVTIFTICKSSTSRSSCEQHRSRSRSV